MSQPNNTVMEGPDSGFSNLAYFMMLAATLISLLGTLMTDFALGQWVYKQTSSATAYGIIGFAALAPQLGFTPLVGTFLDRFPRGSIMIAGHVGAGLCSLSMMFLYSKEMLSFEWILVFVSIGSVFNSFISQSFMVLVPVLVKQEKLIKYQGFSQGGLGIVELSVPALSAFFLVTIGLKGVFIFDVVSFVSAIFILSFIVTKINRNDGRSESLDGEKVSVLQQVKFGFKYLMGHQYLLSLLIFMGVVNFSIGIVHVLLTPLVLSFSTVVELGTVLTAAGIGTLMGSFVLMLLSDVKDKNAFLCWILFFIGIILVNASLIFVNQSITIWVLMVIALMMTLLFVMVESVNQVIWQTSVPSELQGRVLSVQTLVTQMSLPLAFLVAGPMADFVFEPMLNEGGLLASNVGEIIGIGPGRGIAFLYSVCGLMILLSVAIFYKKSK
ncbi:MFS transporter [Vibrio aquimaris]|uniref:Major Facilitator Superfamily protein n=1 Tax=Vibrio aquimaris TaxID=2587862 RepID=A0A5P9CPA4_9VIBR|nr:MFS transporter [Vibrio aquimaris]QFT28026.1 Major Facilitator Superfamily protein [Vibrio aquimaris]